MKRTTIFADEELLAEIKRISEEENRPFSEIVREAMVEYIRLRNQKAPRSRISFIGIVESSSSDIAERHEQLLWKRDISRQA